MNYSDSQALPAMAAASIPKTFLWGAQKCPCPNRSNYSYKSLFFMVKITIIEVAPSWRILHEYGDSATAAFSL
jgi:hypothetical protein